MSRESLGTAPRAEELHHFHQQLRANPPLHML
jgi:hypothetical protein